MNFKLKGFTAFCFWAFCFMLSFWICNAVGTRPIYIQVEDFRKPKMSDEQVLAMAVQKGYDEAPNLWWFNNRKVALIFDTKRTYELSPDLIDQLYAKKPKSPGASLEVEVAAFPFKFK